VGAPSTGACSTPFVRFRGAPSVPCSDADMSPGIAIVAAGAASRLKIPRASDRTSGARDGPLGPLRAPAAAADETLGPVGALTGAESARPEGGETTSTLFDGSCGAETADSSVESVAGANGLTA